MAAISAAVDPFYNFGFSFTLKERQQSLDWPFAAGLPDCWWENVVTSMYQYCRFGLKNACCLLYHACKAMLTIA